MSGGQACQDRRAHRAEWLVITYKAHYSSFNGGQRTASAYSAVKCRACGRVWRTKAAYVDTLPRSAVQMGRRSRRGAP